MCIMSSYDHLLSIIAPLQSAYRRHGVKVVTSPGSRQASSDGSVSRDASMFDNPSLLFMRASNGPRAANAQKLCHFYGGTVAHPYRARFTKTST
jgi:hypothetical protein